jgi:hypothetical protein
MTFLPVNGSMWDLNEVIAGCVPDCLLYTLVR